MKDNRLLTIADIIGVVILSIFILLITNIDTLVRAVTGEIQESYVYFYENVSTVADITVGYLSDYLLTPNIA